MKVRDILDIRSVVLGLTVKDKEELINSMIDLAYQSGNILDISEVRERIFARERLMSTGIGNGIALPHAKTNKITKTVASFAILNSPIEYDSLDGLPVHIVLMIIGKESNIGQNLKLLSEISVIIGKDSFITNVMNAEKPNDILDIFDNQNE